MEKRWRPWGLRLVLWGGEIGVCIRILILGIDVMGVVMNVRGAVSGAWRRSMRFCFAFGTAPVGYAPRVCVLFYRNFVVFDYG